MLNILLLIIGTRLLFSKLAPFVAIIVFFYFSKAPGSKEMAIGAIELIGAATGWISSVTFDMVLEVAKTIL